MIWQVAPGVAVTRTLVWIGDLALSPLGALVFLVAIALVYAELQHRRDRARRIAWLRTNGGDIDLAPTSSQLHRRPRVPPRPGRRP